MLMPSRILHVLVKRLASFLFLAFQVDAYLDGVPVLRFDKTCPEFTSYNGTPVPTRHYQNDCKIITTRNPNRRGDKNITLASMYASSGSSGDHMVVTQPFAKLALQHIEDSDLLPGYRLSAYEVDTRCSGPDAAAATVRVMSTGVPKHGIIGPLCSSACVAANDAMQFFNVPQMCFGVSVALSDRLRHPFLIRGVPSFQECITTSRALFMLFGWHRLGLLHGPRDINKLGRDLFLEYAAEETLAGSYTWQVVLVMETGNQEQARLAMPQIKGYDARVVLNLVYEDVGMQLMCEAFKADLLPPHWLQFIGSGWWSNSALQTMWSSTRCTQDEIYRGGYGWLAANPNSGFVHSSEVHGLSSIPINDIYDAYMTDCMSFYGTELGCNLITAPYYYDAMWLYAHALHQFLIVEGHSYETLNTEFSRERLYNLSLQIDFLGITGRVRQYNLVDPVAEGFDGSIGDREGPSTIRQFVGPQDSTFVTLAYRLPNKTIAWLADVVWSLDDPSLGVDCSSGSCDLERAWLPRDGVPESCPRNTIWRSTNGCTPCAAGEYTNGTTCLPCGAGTASSEAEQETCAACPLGHFSKLLGSVLCAACSPGRFSDVEGSSECRPCGHGGFQNETGRSACQDCPGAFVSPLLGSDAVELCVCPAGSYHPAGADHGLCRQCPEGILCRIGTDMDGLHQLPVVEAGYWSDWSLSVLKCLDDGERCRGGPLGSFCAAGRKGRACFECEEGKAPARGGTCQECDVASSAAPLLLLVMIVAVVSASYFAFSRSDVNKRSHKVLLCAMTASIMVTMMQQVSALETVSFVWPQTMRETLKVLSVLSFNLELFQISCALQPRPLGLFAARIMVCILCGVVLLILHCLVSLRNLMRRERKAPKPVLVNTLGTIAMVFYVSIFISVLVPLQCSRNPNGEWTVKPYPSVVCWAGDGDHLSMCIIGATSAIIPLAYLARCCYAVAVLPHHLRKGDVMFLQAYAFLCFRYKPPKRWYSLFQLFRSLLIALSTIIPDAALQVLSMQVILLIQLTVVSLFQPWRVAAANALEVVLLVGVLIMLNCAALLVSNRSTDALAATFAGLFYGLLSTSVLVGAYAAFAACRQKSRKDYDIFICHHKAGAGCLARYMHVTIAAMGRKPFIDTDNLRNLDKLFDVVAVQTRILCVLCTRFIFMRPWCVGEMVTAVSWNVPISRLIGQDFNEPDDFFIDAYEQHVDDMASLTSCGMHVLKIKQTLRVVTRVEGLSLPLAPSPSDMHSICEVVLQKKLGNSRSNSKSESYHRDPSSKAKVVMVVDMSNTEAACSGFLLIQMVAARIEDVARLPTILTEAWSSRDLSETLICMTLCTHGVFAVHQTLSSLDTVRQSTCCWGLPVLVDEGFVFPTSESLNKQAQLMQQASREPWKLAAFIISLFKIIAMVFQPAHYGSTRQIMQAKAEDLATRITSIERGTISQQMFMLSAARSGEIVGVGAKGVPVVMSDTMAEEFGSEDYEL